MKHRRSSTCISVLPALMISTSLAQTWKWAQDDLVLNPSGLDLSTATSWAWADLDRDGYDDVIVRERDDQGTGKLVAYRGRAPVAPPYWIAAPELLQGLNETSNAAGISLADIDGNGSLNIVTLIMQEPYRYLQNWERDSAGIWRSDSTVFQTLAFDYRLDENDNPFFCDADHDGDMDMLIASSDFGRSGPRFFENTGDAQRALWREDSTRLALVYQNPAGYGSWSPILMYADADTLLDLVVTYIIEGISGVAYYPGIPNSRGPLWGGNYTGCWLQFEGGGAVQLSPYFSAHNNASGLFILQGRTARLYLRSPDSATFDDPNYWRIGPIHSGGISSTIALDYNQDGRMEILNVGHRGLYALLHSYEQKSLWGMKLWQNSHWFTAPTSWWDFLAIKNQLTDLNRNGRMEFVTSEIPFKLQIFETTGADLLSGWEEHNDLLAGFTSTKYGSDTVYFDPSFADLDEDGDPDMLIAEAFCGHTGNCQLTYRFFEIELNSGGIVWKRREDWSAGLGEITYLLQGFVDLCGNFTDLDQDGDADLVFGKKDGQLQAYQNIGTRTSPTWRFWPQVFEAIDAGENASPSFADFDGDGRMDLFVDNAYQELFFFRNETIVSVEEKPAPPHGFALHQNYPNPFNAGTMISYEIPQPGHVQLSIYDLLGRRVATLVDQHQPAQQHQVLWHSQNVASGIHVVELRYGGMVTRKTMELIK